MTKGPRTDGGEASTTEEKREWRKREGGLTRGERRPDEIRERRKDEGEGEVGVTKEEGRQDDGGEGGGTMK